MVNSERKMVVWKVILGAVLIGIAILRVFQALPFLSSRVHHDWMPVFFLVMALFLVVGLWLVISGLRGKRFSA